MQVSQEGHRTSGYPWIRPLVEIKAMDKLFPVVENRGWGAGKPASQRVQKGGTDDSS